MKIAVIDGGSTYTPELVNGFPARTKQFPLDELWLMDLDAERLEIVGGLAQRLVTAGAQPAGRPPIGISICITSWAPTWAPPKLTLSS